MRSSLPSWTETKSKTYKICARFLDKYFVNLNACLRRAFLSFCLSRDWAQVFCFSKPKSFHGTDIAGDEQAPTLAWAIFELPLTYPTYSQVQKLDRTARMWASRQIESAFFAVVFLSVRSSFEHAISGWICAAVTLSIKVAFGLTFNMRVVNL